MTLSPHQYKKVTFSTNSTNLWFTFFVLIYFISEQTDNIKTIYKYIYTVPFLSGHPHITLSGYWMWATSFDKCIHTCVKVYKMSGSHSISSQSYIKMHWLENLYIIIIYMHLLVLLRSWYILIKIYETWMD